MNEKKDAEGVLFIIPGLKPGSVLAAEPDSLEPLVELRHLSAGVDKAL